MRTTQTRERTGVVLGLIVLAVGALPGCIESPTKSVSDTPLCGDSPKAIHHYACAEGYSTGYSSYSSSKDTSKESAK
jgi:hypothetical protein